MLQLLDEFADYAEVVPCLEGLQDLFCHVCHFFIACTFH